MHNKPYQTNYTQQNCNCKKTGLKVWCSVMQNLKIVKPIKPFTYSSMVEQNANFIEPSCHGASSSEKVIGNTKQSTDLNYFSDPNEVPYIPRTNLAMEKFIKETIVQTLSGIFGTRQKELDNVQTAELYQINEAEILQKSSAELSQIEKKTMVNSSNSKNHQKTKVTIQNDLSFKVPFPNPRKNYEMLNEQPNKLMKALILTTARIQITCPSTALPPAELYKEKHKTASQTRGHMK